jgi:hypothetical protein
LRITFFILKHFDFSKAKITPSKSVSKIIQLMEESKNYDDSCVDIL